MPVSVDAVVGQRGVDADKEGPDIGLQALIGSLETSIGNAQALIDKQDDTIAKSQALIDRVRDANEAFTRGEIATADDQGVIAQGLINASPVGGNMPSVDRLSSGEQDRVDAILASSVGQDVTYGLDPSRNFNPTPLASSRVGPTQRQLDKWYPSPLENSRPGGQTDDYGMTFPVEVDATYQDKIVRDNEFFPGAGLTAQQSRELTKALNLDIPKKDRKSEKKTKEQNKKEHKDHAIKYVEDVDKWAAKTKDNPRLVQAVLMSDRYLKAYDQAKGTNKWAKYAMQFMSRGVGTVGAWLEGKMIERGLWDRTTFQEELDNYTDSGRGVPEELAADPSDVLVSPRETVGGGFWGLLNFAKANPDIFGPLSGEELWSLVSDPDDFWKYYEDGLNSTLITGPVIA
tara:strand:- start:1610 stop:2812 length:1203 start_codon:yes stop_codon:yes gene_type:complete